MNALWVRSLGPGPDPLCSESASQALKLALDWACAIASGTNIMTATVITMADRRMFILLGVRPTNISIAETSVLLLFPPGKLLGCEVVP